MLTLTKAQRTALHKLWQRNTQDLTYRQFRKTVQPYFGGDPCVLVPWCGMWLGIEHDGYTHS
jgi:hypothetical protein